MRAPGPSSSSPPAPVASEIFCFFPKPASFFFFSLLQGRGGGEGACSLFSKDEDKVQDDMLGWTQPLVLEKHADAHAGEEVYGGAGLR